MQYPKAIFCSMYGGMDCEGEEYQIMNRLSQANILNEFSFIMLEWHYLGNKSILDLLKAAGFSY